MKRSEYLNTEKGKALEKFKRFRKNIWIEIDQEPGTKKSLSQEEKARFRKEVSNFLKSNKRKAFRNDIILKIEFFTSQDNVPPLRTLTKNYLDLLHKPMPDVDKLNRILFNDDDQIKLLITNYNFDYFGNKKPRIRIRAQRFSLFKEDLELAQFVHRNYDVQEEFNRSNNLSNFDNDYDQYLDLLNDEKWMVKNDMLDSFNLTKQFLRQRVQESYLKSNSINFENLFNIFQSSFKKNKILLENESLQRIWETMEKISPLAFNAIPLGGAPIASGQKKIFKQTIEEKLDEFKSKHKILFPLVHPIGIILFYTPPIRNSLDLDNLAKMIMPKLIESFNPPPSIHSSLEYLEKFPELYKLSKSKQKLPKTAITNYQVVNRTRRQNSPEAGEIDLFITDGMQSFYNLWSQIDSLTDFVD